MFSAALTVWSNITFFGNSRVDSYDSMDPNYSTSGHYDPAKRKAGGDLKADIGPARVDSLHPYSSR
jgi:hypothetical protein